MSYVSHVDLSLQIFIDTSTKIRITSIDMCGLDNDTRSSLVLNSVVMSEIGPI